MPHQSHRRLSRLRGMLLAAGAAGLIGCGHDAPLAPLPLQSQAPDFALEDVNPNSATHAKTVSPRSQLGKVSAWYFGHAT